MLGLVLTASCAAAFKVPAARPAIVWQATMTLSQDEKDRRHAAYQEVLAFAAENKAVGSLAQCSVIISRKTTLSPRNAHVELTKFKNSLPQESPLRAAYDAVVARAQSTESIAARARSGCAKGLGKSIVDMRGARVAYAARSLPSLDVSGERLRAELERAVAATVATPQKQLEGMEECACNEAFLTTKKSYELAVAVEETVGSINVAENSFCLISERLVTQAASVWDAQNAKNERAIQMEGVLQAHYDAEKAKMAKPRRGAGRAASNAMHEGRFDAHGGGRAVLEAPVALTKAPGDFVSCNVDMADRTYGELKAIADAVEAEQKIRAVSRVVCMPLRRSALYHRLRATALSEGGDLCPSNSGPCRPRYSREARAPPTQHQI